MSTSANATTPAASSPAARARFEGQRRADTKPEMAIRRELHRRGWRYRVDYAPLATDRRRRADIVFTRRRLAVFVDGCFWHQCPTHGTMPRANREWWRDKLDRNVARDRDTDARLREAGWMVVRIWEHEAVDVAVSRIERSLDECT